MATASDRQTRALTADFAPCSGRYIQWMDSIQQALRGRYIRPWPAVVGVAVVIGVAVLAIVFDWNWFKSPLERYVSGATGRRVRDTR